VTVFVPLLYCFGYYGSVVPFEVWYYFISRIALFAQDCFSYLGLYCFLVNFRIGFSTSVENDIELLMGIAFNL
jgi:hypothetical protein